MTDTLESAVGFESETLGGVKRLCMTGVMAEKPTTEQRMASSYHVSVKSSQSCELDGRSHEDYSPRTNSAGRCNKKRKMRSTGVIPLGIQIQSRNDKNEIMFNYKLLCHKSVRRNVTFVSTRHDSTNFRSFYPSIHEYEPADVHLDGEKKKGGGSRGRTPPDTNYSSLKT